MFLTLSTTCQPATDLGFLLHKNPSRVQEFELAFGKVYVFYPEASEERCTAALLLDVDPVAMVRGKPGSRMGGPLDQYVNDRPYTASSFLSVAIAQVYGTALRGQCKTNPELAKTPIPLEAKITVLPCRRGGEAFLRRLFEPLGYEIDALQHELDGTFADWGMSSYFTVTVRKKTTLKEMLTHLYVLVPVLDNSKHYYVGDDEVEKLLKRGRGWLTSHPEKDAITRRYLKYRPTLARQALTRLAEENEPVSEENGAEKVAAEEDYEEKMNLNEARLGAVVAALKSSGARRVLDLGCGEGKLLRELLKVKQFEEIVGMDVSIRSLEIAQVKLRLDRLAERVKERIKLLHGSLLYRDKRLEGYDAAAVVEVVEHLDEPRLAAFEKVVFGCMRPKTVILTTPNREYNVKWGIEGTEGDEPPLRHGDHRFEWDRSEFKDWASGIGEDYGYHVEFLPIGPEDAKVGAPTQMGVFSLQS